MSWASHRRSLYISIFFVALFIIISAFGYVLFYEEPTCFDGKKNGGEDGVDCGGSCALVCPFSVSDPVVLWSRFFEIAPGVYSVVAVAENPNVNAVADDVPYSFKLRDDRGILITEQTGTIDIPQSTRFAIFETGVTTGGRSPTLSFFEFTATPEWQKAEDTVNLSVRDSLLVDSESAPHLSALLINPSFETIIGIRVIAVVSNTSGNAVGVSSTLVDTLGPEGSAPLVFTWPRAFSGSAGPVEFFVTFDTAE